MNPEPHPDNKTAWRQWAKETRASLPVSELSAEVRARLREWPVYQRADRVLIYLAFGSEVELAGLADDKQFFVTRTPETVDQGLTIHRLDADMEKHRYGYLQPTANAEVVDPRTLELALIPGLCFDRRGTRLGYGKGYYDRLLPLLSPTVPRVGITLSPLIVPELPRNGFDVPMTQLVTELGVQDLMTDFKL